ncbi:MAG: DMT family transporter [Maritimibacter sp.]
MKTPLPPSSKSNTVLAALWMSGAIASFSAMAVAGRELSTTHDTFELMFYRSLVGVVIVFSLTTVTGRWGEVTGEKFGMHMLRNLAHFSGQNLWFFAVTVIPLVQVFALEFTSPLWVLVLAPWLLGERITPVRALAAVLGFVGILIIARPGAAPISAGMIAAALAAICFAVTIVLTRKLTRSQSVTAILVYLTASQAVFGLITAAIDGDIALPTAQSAPLLGLVGCAGLLAHFCLTQALRLAPATVTIPIDFSRLPVIALIGWVFYGESLEGWVILGAAFILVANVINLRAEAKP